MIENLTVYVGDDSTSFRLSVTSINKLAYEYKTGYDTPGNFVYLHTTKLSPKELYIVLTQAKEVIYYVAPVGQKEDYVERIMSVVKPFL